MKHILLIPMLFAFMAAAAQVSPAKKTFSVQKNATLTLVRYGDGNEIVDPQIEAGQRLVFYYEWNSPKNPQIADADRTDKLYFELTAAQAKSFKATGEALAGAKTVRCRICFCLEGGCRPDTRGELSVKKAGRDRYAVKFKDDPESERYLVNEIFTLKK